MCGSGNTFDLVRIRMMEGSSNEQRTTDGGGGLLTALAAGDGERVLSLLSDNAAGIDEASRRWLYGGRSWRRTMRLARGPQRAQLCDVATDVHQDVLGDTAFVTAILEQTYQWPEGVRRSIGGGAGVLLGHSP